MIQVQPSRPYPVGAKIPTILVSNLNNIIILHEGQIMYQKVKMSAPSLIPQKSPEYIATGIIFRPSKIKI